MLVGDQPADLALGAFASHAACVQVLVVESKMIADAQHVRKKMDYVANPRPAVVIPVNACWMTGDTIPTIKRWAGKCGAKVDLRCTRGATPATILADRLAEHLPPCARAMYRSYRMAH